MDAQERVARILCRLMGDEWQQGEQLYRSTADEIIATLAPAPSLIAAAPDLLDAAFICLGYIGYADVPIEPAANVVRAKLRAAVAKAEAASC